MPTMITEDGYPPDWPRCPACGRAALDGHITCGDAACDEGEQRRGHRVCPDTWRAFGTWAVDGESRNLLAAGIPPENRYRVAQQIANDRGETVYLYLDGGDADDVEAIEPEVLS